MRGKGLKKTILFSILLLAVLSFSLALVPSVRSDPADVKIVSYSWYLDDAGILWVVGEVQNTGTSIIRYVTLTATATQGDGAQTQPSTGQAWAKYLLPGQKAPFGFPIDNTNTGSGAWAGIPVAKIDISVTQADDTPIYQYADLKITNTAYMIDSNSTYWVTGKIQNVGTQAVTGLTMVASFYNSSGVIIGAGNLEADSMALAPSSETTFKVNAFDLNTTTVSSNRRIESYSVFAQVSTPLLEAQGAVPTASPTTNVGPAPTPLGSNSNSSSGDSNMWIYIVAVVVVVAVVGAVVALRMRKPKAKASTPQVLTKKQKKKAERNAKR